MLVDVSNVLCFALILQKTDSNILVIKDDAQHPRLPKLRQTPFLFCFKAAHFS